MQIQVYLPREATLPGLPGSDITVRRYESSAELATLLASNGGSPAVLLTAGLAEDEQETIAAAIRAYAVQVVEVRTDRWDGFSASPLSAACRGVIAGFGSNGVVAAAAILRTT